MTRRSAQRTVPRAFLFADLRGYTAFVERTGDAAARHLLQGYRGLVRRQVTRERGAEIKTEGDSFYVVFRSCAAAVRCAMSIQQAATRRRKDPFQIGIGIHAGEALSLDRQYVGGAVNLASRLAAAAASGEILISETVHGLIRTAMRVRFEDHGALALKGFGEPVRAYAIRLPAPAPVVATVLPVRPVEAMRQGNLDEAVRLARNLRADAPADARCDALTVLVIMSASHGDLEGALSWTERLVAVAPRTSDRAWVTAAYALRAWCYALARQPGEAKAELERALERPTPSPVALILVLLAVSIAGAPADGNTVRQMGDLAGDLTLRAVCGTMADVLEEKSPVSTTVPMLGRVCGPLLAELIELQLVSRRPGEVRPPVRHPAADRLAAMIFAAVQ
jgi:class 3 adenylate cyclase